jgi:protein gp37
MSASTAIEWTDATWNPVTGCTKVSPGCDHCYAATFAERFRGTPGHYFAGGFDVELRPAKLTLPLTWRRPRRVFVNSMSDLFHRSVPDEYIARVFVVMALAREHTFQVLTKRYARMRSLLGAGERWRDLLRDADSWACGLDVAVPTERYLAVRRWIYGTGIHTDPVEPLPNVWLGVSVENQRWADNRVPSLLRTPAAVRFLSCEPLLGPVDLSRWLGIEHYDSFGWGEEMFATLAGRVGPAGGLGWVIAGGESGPGARPMDPEWVRSLRDQCVAAGVPFLFKQWGGRTPKTGGRDLDGRTWNEFPTDVRGTAPLLPYTTDCRGDR